MKKTFLLLSAACTLFLSSQAQKVYETKLTTGSHIGFGLNKEFAVYAGSKNLNVVQLSDGKMILDKAYKDLGSTVVKGSDAYSNESLSKIVICNANTVSCLDIKTGKLLWENKSFGALDNEDKALIINDDYVLVSDNKGKENNTLTCLSLSEGKILWTLDQEKERIKIENLYLISSGKYFGVYNKRKKEKTNLFRILSVETGKVLLTNEMEGTPIYNLMDIETANVFIHHRVSEEVSYISAFNFKEGKFLWKVKSANKSPQTPMYMNTNKINYYATIQTFENKVMLKTEGIEVFEIGSGKLLYNIPFVPYYSWGVGHYTNGIFEPIVTSNGILIADRTQGDLCIKMMDKNSGKQIWSTEKLKKKNCAPVAVITGKSVAIQFGGLNYFEVMNNTGIGKLLDPFCVTSFDLETGKVLWNVESKKDFYYIAKANNNVMIVGTKEFQTVDAQTGAIVKADKNGFGEDYFMTTFGLSSTHKFQKNASFDFSTKTVLLFEDNRLTKTAF